VREARALARRLTQSERNEYMSIVVPPGQGKQLEARGSVMLFKAVAATTGAAFR